MPYENITNENSCKIMVHQKKICSLRLRWTHWDTDVSKSTETNKHLPMLNNIWWQTWRIIKISVIFCFSRNFRNVCFFVISSSIFFLSLSLCVCACLLQILCLNHGAYLHMLDICIWAEFSTHSCSDIAVAPHKIKVYKYSRLKVKENEWTKKTSSISNETNKKRKKGKKTKHKYVGIECMTCVCIWYVVDSPLPFSLSKACREQFISNEYEFGDELQS